MCLTPRVDQSRAAEQRNLAVVWIFSSILFDSALKPPLRAERTRHERREWDGAGGVWSLCRFVVLVVQQESRFRYQLVKSSLGENTFFFFFLNKQILLLSRNLGREQADRYDSIMSFPLYSPVNITVQQLIIAVY